MRLRKPPRRRIQRAFHQWLQEARNELPFRISIVCRTERLIECRFLGVTSAIRIALTDDSLCVSAEKDGEYWDNFTCFDAVPQKEGSGYVCALCLPERRVRYARRDGVWRAELFEPFRDWIIGDFANAEWVAFHELPGGNATWVVLERDAVPEDALPISLVERRRICADDKQ